MWEHIYQKAVQPTERKAMKYGHVVPKHWKHQQQLPHLRLPTQRQSKTLRGQTTCDNPSTLPLRHSKVNLTITGAPRAVFQMNEVL